MRTFTNLLPHQIAAVEKLQRLKVGALYMEMGTGKTRTALELVKLRLDAEKVAQVLWLCPCSVKKNLLEDIRKHSDLAESEDLLTICGIETLSSSIRTCQQLLEMVKKSKTFIIVDESTLIKNHQTLRSRHITQVARECPYRLILNGTPITRTAADLFSQWYLLDPRILGYNSFWSFSANHLEFDEKDPSRIVRALNTDYLAKKIEPYTYQCLKSDVIKLPDKISQVETFYMSDAQDEQYEECIQKLLTDLDEMQSESIYQLFGALQSVTSGFTIQIDSLRSNHSKVSRIGFANTAESNPRIKKLIDVIDSIGEDKALIFCTYTEEIKAVVSTLNKLKPNCAVPFFGEINQKKRQKHIELFVSDAQFLVANKTCGAFGLNLQFCHRIIFYSHDWNWGTRAQAEDRVHRFGQTEDVVITDIVASGTIDISILKCLYRKEGLSDSFKQEISKQSVLNIAKGRLYG